jgi:transcriptional regulator with XRE-family HTH domain
MAEQLTIGQKIRKARKAAGLTQEQAAHLLGVTSGCWPRWEQGRTKPDFDRLDQIAEMLDCELIVELRPKRR